MAKSGYASGANEAVKIWSEKLFRETRKEAYWEKLFGGPDSVVQEDSFFTKNKGEIARFTYVQRLTSAGVTEGTQLEGNEEKLTSYTVDVTLGQYRQGVRDDGALSRQRVAFDLPATCKDVLKVWGSEKIDQICFDTIGLGSGASGNPSRVVYWNASTGAFTVAAAWGQTVNSLANSGLSLNGISQLKRLAQTGGSSRAYSPMRPIKYKGQNLYVLMVHPYALCDLRNTTAFQTAQREAQLRGEDNPIFTGAEAYWDGVVIHSHESIQYSGASTRSRGVLMGAQALVWAWGARQEIVEEDFDYGNERGFAWQIIAGAKAPVFNSKEFGALHFECFGTNLG